MAVTEDIIIKRSTAYRMLIFEASIVLLCAFLFLLLVNHEFAYSVILGGLAFIFPNAIFAWFSLRTPTTNSSGNKILIWFFIAEAIKVVSTIIVFAASIILVADINIGLMFVSYGVVLLMNLTGLAFLMKNK